MFAAQGNVDTFWLVETASGEQRTLVTPMSPPPRCDLAQYKQRLIDHVRGLFAQHGVERYALAVEGWIRRDRNLPAVDAQWGRYRLVALTPSRDLFVFARDLLL